MEKTSSFNQLKKPWAEGRSHPQELEVGPRSGLYSLVILDYVFRIATLITFSSYPVDINCEQDPIGYHAEYMYEAVIKSNNSRDYHGNLVVLKSNTNTYYQIQFRLTLHKTAMLERKTSIGDKFIVIGGKYL